MENKGLVIKRLELGKRNQVLKNYYYFEIFQWYKQRVPFISQPNFQQPM